MNMKKHPELIPSIALTANGITAFTLDNAAKGPNSAGYDFLSVQVNGTFVATGTIEFSNDGTNYLPLSIATDLSSIATPVGTFTLTGKQLIIPMLARFCRIRSTAWVSGTANLVVMGHQGNPKIIL